MSVEFDRGVACDADLVGAAAAGDRAAFAGIYDRYADRLHDYCLGMVGDRDAADCVQETFFVAFTSLPSLRDPDKLRPWLYAIARNQALRTLRNRTREMTSAELPEIPTSEAGPNTVVQRNELAALIAQAKGGLSDRDCEVLDLVYRHGLSGAELAQALDVGTASAKKIAQRLRDTIERSLGALLIARQARAGHHRCPELATLVADWDGEFTVLVRKRISRHVESCANCDEHRGRLVSPTTLLGVAPLLIPAPGWLRDQTLTQMHGVGAAVHSVAQTGKFAAWVVALLAVPAAALGAALIATAPQDVPSAPVQVSSSVASTTPLLAPTSVPDPNGIAPEPSTPPPPSVGAPSADAPLPGYRGAPPPVPVPVPPTSTVVADAPQVPPGPQAPPASRAPATTTAPQAPESKKPPQKPKPTQPTTTQAPPPPQACPRIAVDNNPTCGRPTP